MLHFNPAFEHEGLGVVFEVVEGVTGLDADGNIPEGVTGAGEDVDLGGAVVDVGLNHEEFILIEEGFGG